MKTLVGIPVLGRLDLTQKVVGLLREHGGYDELHIFDNGSEDDTWTWLKDQSDLEAHYRPGVSLYTIWNDAWHFARQLGDANLVLLNNDITFGKEFLQTLAHHLRANVRWAVACPRLMAGHRSTIMTGFAFMLKAELADRGLCLFDEGYRIYGGDFDFAKQVVEAGYEIGWVKEAPVWHEGSATLNEHPELRAIAEGPDQQRWRDKWETAERLI